MAKVAINGMGRIGRATLKILMASGELDIVAVNDLLPPDDLVYLMKYDTVYGKYDKHVGVDGSDLIIDTKHVRLTNEKDPSRLPWEELGVDMVFECTGVFTRKEDLQKHLMAGAKHVILSAPSKSPELLSVVHGVNKPEQPPSMVSCASCTTNCITPVVEIIGRRLGLKKAVMTTVHAYTSSQGIVDGPSKKPERGRAGAMNLVPTSTGAAVATTRVLPEYENRFDGIAIRVPVAIGSIADITMVTERPTSVAEVNDIFREEAASDRYREVIGVSDDPIVSSDIIADPRASIVDLLGTQVVDGDLVKVLSWYDNEWGYSSQMVREAKRMLA